MSVAARSFVDVDEGPRPLGAFVEADDVEMLAAVDAGVELAVGAR